MKNMTIIKHAQKGFTLIELMIVVAIIAILAAIAIPQYQVYVVKSQVTRAIAEAADQKLTVEDCLNNGRLVIGSAVGATTKCDPTATGSDILTGLTQGSTVVATTTGVPQISPATMVSTGNILITATFGNHASGVLTAATSTVILTRDPAGTWICKFSGLNKYAPASCPGA